MNIHAILGCIIIVGSVLLGLHPFAHLFGERRVFAGWSKAVFAIVGTLGPVLGAMTLAQAMGWWPIPEKEDLRLERFLSFGRGLAVGLLLSLFLSGQLVGIKKPKKGTEKEPNKASEPTATNPPLSAMPPAPLADL